VAHSSDGEFIEPAICEEWSVKVAFSIMRITHSELCIAACRGQLEENEKLLFRKGVASHLKKGIVSLIEQTSGNTGTWTSKSGKMKMSEVQPFSPSDRVVWLRKCMVLRTSSESGSVLYMSVDESALTCNGAERYCQFCRLVQKLVAVVILAAGVFNVSNVQNFSGGSTWMPIMHGTIVFVANFVCSRRRTPSIHDEPERSAYASVLLFSPV